MNTGKIVQVSGPVIDIEFETGKIPKLRDAITVTVNGTGTVAYSPLTYCYKALNSDNAKLVNTVKALYNYHLAAHEYF